MAISDHLPQWLGTFQNASLWPEQPMPTMDEVIANIKAVKAAMAAHANCANEARACTDCGSWSKPCDCRYEAIDAIPACYICGGFKDVSKSAWLSRCLTCVRRYL